MIDKFETYFDLHKFACKVNIKKYFAIEKKSNRKDNPDDEPEDYQLSGLKSPHLISNPRGITMWK